MTLELLSEKVVDMQSSFRKVVRYYKGFHPELKDAVLIGNGWTGRETKQETTIVRARQSFMVTK